MARTKVTNAKYKFIVEKIRQAEQNPKPQYLRVSGSVVRVREALINDGMVEGRQFVVGTGVTSKKAGSKIHTIVCTISKG